MAGRCLVASLKVYSKYVFSPFVTGLNRFEVMRAKRCSAEIDGGLVGVMAQLRVIELESFLRFPLDLQVKAKRAN